MLQAKLAVKNIELGTNVREIDIFDPKDATRKVATHKVPPPPPPATFPSPPSDHLPD